MKDEDKTMKRLIKELEDSRQRIAELEASEANRKQAEEALWESESILNETGSIARIGGWEHDLITGQATWTKALYDIIEIESGAPPGPNEHLDYYPPPDRATLAAAYQRTMETGEPFDLELQCRTAKKRHLWVRAIGRPVFHEGKCIRMMGTFQDITERKQVEDALREAKNFSDSLIAAMKDGFSVLDSHGVHIDVNPAFCQMTGFSREELIGVGPPHPYWPPEAYEEIEKVFQKTLRGEFGGLELTFLRKNGERFPVIVSPSSVKGKQGNVISYFATVKDITERKLAEEALRQSEERYRAVMEQSFEAIHLVDAETKRVTEANRAFAEMLGYRAQEIVGLSIYDIVAADPEDVSRKFEEILQGKGPLPYERQWRRKDGSLLYVWIIVSPISYGGKKVICAIAHEITERKRSEEELRKHREHLEDLVRERTSELLLANEQLQREVTHRGRAEEALRQNEERHRAVVEQSADGIFLVDVETRRIMEANRAFAQMLGYSPEEALTLSVHDFIAASREDIDRRFQKTLRGKGPLSFERKYRRRDGSLIDVWVSTNIISYGQGGAMCTIVRDITERKRAEEALRQNEERHRAVVEQSADGIFLVDVETRRIMEANRSFAQMLGYSPEEAQTLSVHDFIAASREDIDRRFQSLLTEGRFAFERQYRRKDGSLLTVELAGNLISYEGRQVMCAIVRDITERRRADAEIRKLNEELKRQATQLESVNKELETFTYSVSHDLKAPLRGIDGYSRLLLEEHASQLNEEGCTFLCTIRSAAQQMSQLIDDLLTYSRLERRPQSTGTLNPRDLVETLLAQRAEEVEARQVALSVDIPCEAVKAEAEGLSQALGNLLDNALKFTRKVPTPRIEIGGRREGNSCILWVRDNGIGFEPQYQERIFEIFQRLHRVEDYPGTGIGLAIVRKAMQRMGGRVWAESAPGEGATFYLELPIKGEP